MKNDKELASSGFAHGNLYNDARPRYPQEAVVYFLERFGLDDTSHVLDLGAGTGIFSRQLLSHVGRLTAVDPSASMRATFATSTPGVEILDGSDVAIPLADHELEAVFVAQAFHWFDAPRALQEIHRGLRPGGNLGLIWNDRDTATPWIRDLNHAMRWDVHQPYDANVDVVAIVAAGPFGDVVRRDFHHRYILTHAQVLHRVLSTSYITLATDEERGQIISEVMAVLEPLANPIEVPYVTITYCATAQ